jgi:hypothetical protein
MANHKRASSESKSLCERLFASLEQRLGHLTYKQGKNKCSIEGTGRVFAWVNSHSIRTTSINIWFLGSADAAKQFSGLSIHARPNPDEAGGWEPYGGSFNIKTESQLFEAVELLSTISFPESLKTRQ